MTSEARTLVVAVEDLATAGIVGASAAHTAMDEGATAILLLHVMESHAVTDGLVFTMPVPLMETEPEARSVLDAAEAALVGEFGATDRPAPEITRRLAGGAPAGRLIAQAASEVEAAGIVVGARRPHAFGRLAHADVRDSLSHHTDIPIHVARLQEQ
jgi:nucleotide-binding universal stress UspA family protein